MRTEVVAIDQLKAGDVLLMCNEHNQIIATGLVIAEPMLNEAGEVDIDVAIKKSGYEIVTQRYPMKPSGTIARVIG